MIYMYQKNQMNLKVLKKVRIVNKIRNYYKVKKIRIKKRLERIP